MQNSIINIFLPLFLLINVIKSGLIVAYKIITNKKIVSRIYKKHTKKNALKTSLIANSITITPGTIAMEVEPGKITIHEFDY